MSYKISVIDEDTGKTVESYGELEEGDMDIELYRRAVVAWIGRSMRVGELMKKEKQHDLYR